MILNDNLFQFHDYMISLLQFSNIFGKILDSFKLQNFWTRNLKLMAKDKKVNIEVTQPLLTPQQHIKLVCLSLVVISSAIFAVAGKAEAYPSGDPQGTSLNEQALATNITRLEVTDSNETNYHYCAAEIITAIESLMIQVHKEHSRAVVYYVYQ